MIVSGNKSFRRLLAMQWNVTVYSGLPVDLHTVAVRYLLAANHCSCFASVRQLGDCIPPCSPPHPLSRHLFLSSKVFSGYSRKGREHFVLFFALCPKKNHPSWIKVCMFQNYYLDFWIKKMIVKVGNRALKSRYFRVILWWSYSWRYDNTKI